MKSYLGRVDPSDITGKEKGVSEQEAETYKPVSTNFCGNG